MTYAVRYSDLWGGQMTGGQDFGHLMGTALTRPVWPMTVVATESSQGYPQVIPNDSILGRGYRKGKTPPHKY